MTHATDSIEATELKAGRELDALVAEKVMAWRWLRVPVFMRPVFLSPVKLNEYLPEFVASNTVANDGADPPERCPHYSTDIAAAWEVHRNMCDRLFSVRRRYYAEIQEQTSPHVSGSGGALVAWPDVLTVLRNRFPEAICLAALKSVESPK